MALRAYDLEEEDSNVNLLRMELYYSWSPRSPLLKAVLSLRNTVQEQTFKNCSESLKHHEKGAESTTFVSICFSLPSNSQRLFPIPHDSSLPKTHPKASWMKIIPSLESEGGGIETNRQIQGLVSRG